MTFNFTAFMKKNLIVALLFSSFTAFSQNNCGNVDFESGSTAGWTCKSGSYGIPSPGDCNVNMLNTLNLTAGACINAGDNISVDWGAATQNRHCIVSQKNLTDPNASAANPVSCVAPANLFPNNTNNVSFRLGNDQAGGQNGLAMAEGIRFSFTVDKNNAGLTYMYAAFLKESNPIHLSAEAPRFTIKVTQTVNGKEEPIDCGFYNVDASAGGGAQNFFTGKSDGQGVWKYTKWTKVALDLTSYIGKVVNIEFNTADCYPLGGTVNNQCMWSTGTHSAYAYIDLYCTPLEIISPDVCANMATVKICGPDGYSSYEWDPSGPGLQPPFNEKCVTINNPKAGDKYTVTLKSVAGGCPTKTTITLKGADFTVANATTCPGKPVQLTVKPTNGTLADYDWKWEPATNLSCTNCPEPTFTPGTDMTYTVTMVDKDIKNCNQIKVMNVKVGSGFSVTATGASICPGDSATLTASGADTYTWEPGGLTGASVVVKPTQTTTYTVTGTSSSSSCPGNATTTATVEMKPGTALDAGPDQAICFGETATLGGKLTGAPAAITWTGGTGTFNPDNKTLTAQYTPSPAEMAAGTVTLTLTAPATGTICPVIDSKTTITINPVAVVDAGPDQKICLDGSVTLAGVASGGAVSGIWSGGTGVYSPNASTANAVYTPSKSEQALGKVTLKFTTNDPPGPCPAVEDEVTIYMDQKPIAIAGDPVSICDGKTIKLNGKILGAATSGTWSGGQGVFNKSNTDLTGTYTPTPQEVAAGKVKLYLTTNAAGLCPISVDSVTHFIYPNPIVKFGVDIPKACPDHCVSFFDSTTAGNTKIVKWLWDFGKYGTSTEKNPKLCFPDPGKYDVTLTATSDKDCQTTLKKDYYIETFAEPKAMFTADPWQASLYDPAFKFFDQSTSDVPINTWIWNLGDGTIVSPKNQKPVHKYEIGVYGKYYVSLFVRNDNGCVDSITRPVEVLPEFTFYIPNAFTPNRNDGINDTFFGKGVGIVEYHIWIFDRWGNMIFNTTDINEGWDGRANNGAEIAQQDVYVWKVKLKDIFGKYHDYIGTVTLAR